LIRVTKLNAEVFYVNPYEIEFIEETPDTVISLKSGKKVLVTERAEDVIKEMIEFYRLTVPLTKTLYPEPDGKETREDLKNSPDEDG
jgi:flagellar protein FlbD